MTAFAPANLPAGIDTLEKLAAWSLGAIYQLRKNDRYQESDAAPLIPLITAQDGMAADGSERIIFRISLILDSQWRESGLKFFLNAEEYPGSPSIPALFLP